MKSNSLIRKLALFLVVFYAGIADNAFSQIPASLEKELIQFNADLYGALEIINTQNEKDAVAKLAVVKPKLIQQAEALSAKISKYPELSEAEEDAWVQRMMENKVILDLTTLLSNPVFLQKIESSQALQKEFLELMAILDMGTGSEQEQEQVSLSGSQVCTFTVGSGSPYSGTYVINSMEGESYAYNDFENEQFVIEIHGDNYIDAMLIIEKPVTGRHTFTMEMQVAIDISKNEGEDYYGFDNYREEGGGYIQIDRLDDEGGVVSGSFKGLFNDGSTEDDSPVNIEGRFSVKRME
jgi:hypothetical protein